MKTDENDLIVDGQRGDGGDSCNFNCTYLFLGECPENYNNHTKILRFWNNGKPVRHPTQVPWNNPKNLSRDQAIPLISVLPKDLVRKFFWSCIKRGGFLPNFERDVPGSTKYPWPHKVNGKWRLFDFADPMGFDFMGMMILRGKIYALYPLAAFGFIQCFISILFHARAYKKDTTETDFKQLFITSKTYGLDGFFYMAHPDMKKASESYFCGWRDLAPIHDEFMIWFDDYEPKD